MTDKEKGEYYRRQCELGEYGDLMDFDIICNVHCEKCIYYGVFCK